MGAGDRDNAGGVLAAAEAARAAPPGPESPRTVDVLLDGLALRVTDGYAAAAPTLARARYSPKYYVSSWLRVREWSSRSTRDELRVFPRDILKPKHRLSIDLAIRAP